MPHASAIFGKSELIIEQVNRHDRIEVWAKSSKRPICKHCDNDKLRIKATHQRTVKELQIKSDDSLWLGDEGVYRSKGPTL